MTYKHLKMGSCLKPRRTKLIDKKGVSDTFNTIQCLSTNLFQFPDVFLCSINFCRKQISPAESGCD
jgi:hypothetical protein